MKLFGWILAIFGLLGCILTAALGATTAAFEQQGIGAIAVAIAGVGALFAGVWLLIQGH